jgi:hypothetical protein
VPKWEPASATKVPASWPDLVAFNCFKLDFDDEEFVPTLPNEWLMPIELSQRRQQEQVQRSQDGADSPYMPAHDNNKMQPQRAPPIKPDVSQRVLPIEDPASGIAQTAAPKRVLPPQVLPEEPSPHNIAPAPESPTPVRQNPQQNCQTTHHFCQHSFAVVRSYC